MQRHSGLRTCLKDSPGPSSTRRKGIPSSVNSRANCVNCGRTLLQFSCASSVISITTTKWSRLHPEWICCQARGSRGTLNTFSGSSESSRARALIASRARPAIVPANINSRKGKCISAMVKFLRASDNSVWLSF